MFEFIISPVKPYHRDLLGLLPIIFNAHDPRPAAAQANERYAHGGGWQPFGGFTLGPEDEILYPGDPAFRPFARLRLPLSSETVLVYPYSWVVVKNDNGGWEVCRMD